jgi:hypothetical protein
MDVRLLFPLSAAMGLIAWSLLAGLHVWPRLRTISRGPALAILAIPHTFRFAGLSFLVPGVVSPSLPRAFAVPAAYGDLITAVLALAAVIALSRRWWWGIPVAWLMNLWGTADLLYANYAGIAVDLDAGKLGAAFFIPTALVPLLLVAHALAFRLLFAHAADALGRHRSGDQPPPPRP